MVNKGLRRLKKANTLNLKILNKKLKSIFMIYADFESIIAPESNGKQNPDESYANKCQKHVACSYGYKLVAFIIS